MTDPKTLNVVISQSRGGPASTRVFEGGIRSALSKAPGIEVSLIPHLYDLTRDHPAIQFLSELRGDVVVLSWLYPRAAYWVLQHNGVAGDLLNAVGAGVGGAGRTSDRPGPRCGRICGYGPSEDAASHRGSRCEYPHQLDGDGVGLSNGDRHQMGYRQP